MLRTRPARATAAAALAAAAALSLSSCAIGFQAATTTQLASGNGANINLGDLQIRDITLVQGAEGTGTGTIIGTIVNRGTESDTLLGAAVVTNPTPTVTIAGTAAVAGALPLPAQSSTRVGYNADDHVDVTGLQVTPTQYVVVELRFRNAGTVRLDVMAVLPTGIYEGIAPLPVA